MPDAPTPRDPRKVHIPAPGAGSIGDAARAPVRARPRAAPTPPARPATPPRSATPTRTRTRPPASAPTSKRHRLLPSRPRLRRVLLLSSLLLPVLLLLALLGGWLFARSAYERVEKIPLADVLSPAAAGTNYLIVGSDTRDPQAIIDAGLDPAAFQDGGGQRSDTMMLLRFVKGEAKMLSIPRDLYVKIAETNGSAKINAAYSGGGPRRLVLTVEQALQVPIQHYLEVDFVSFAGMVDALGGISIDFPNPAYDATTGLSVTNAGPHQFNGANALAFVRSRHYVDVIDGRPRPDVTSDLGRVQRQQQFLKAIFSKLGHSHNPIALLRAGSNASSGVRVDDTLGMTDAIRFAWRLRSLEPTSVVLPTKLGSNRAGSVLFRVDPEADAALMQFR